jgi:hypothetical protein
MTAILITLSPAGSDPHYATLHPGYNRSYPATVLHWPARRSAPRNDRAKIV